MVAEIPNTNKILKRFEPMTLPRAISTWPFFAAITEVTSSGSDVPTATIVSPTIFSAKFASMPIAVAPITARFLAPTTTSSPPKAIPSAPKTKNSIAFHTGISFISSSSSSLGCFLLSKIR